MVGDNTSVPKWFLAFSFRTCFATRLVIIEAMVTRAREGTGSQEASGVLKFVLDHQVEVSGQDGYAALCRRALVGQLR